jgi:hypothetical protein
MHSFSCFGRQNSQSFRVLFKFPIGHTIFFSFSWAYVDLIMHKYICTHKVSDWLEKPLSNYILIHIPWGVSWFYPGFLVYLFLFSFFLSQCVQYSGVQLQLIEALAHKKEGTKEKEEFFLSNKRKRMTVLYKSLPQWTSKKTRLKNDKF